MVSTGPRPLCVALLCRGGHGGSTVAAIDLAAALAGRGHRVLLAAATVLGRAPATVGGRVEVLEVDGTGDLVPAVERALGPATLDVVHAHYARPLAAVALDLADRRWSHAGRPRVAVTLHGTDVTGLAPAEVAPLAATLGRADLVAAASLDLRAAAERLGLADRIATVHGGLDTGHWRPVPGADRPELVHVSTLRPLKRVPRLVGIFALARLLGLDRRVTLRIVGDGPDRRAAERRTRELGLGRAVRFEGAYPIGPSDLSGARAVVSFSEQESFGLSLLEGLACGVPLAAPAVGGIAELAGSRPPGFLTRTPRELARALVRLGCADDPGLRRSARARAEIFTIERTARRYEELYRQKVCT